MKTKDYRGLITMNVRFLVFALSAVLGPGTAHAFVMGPAMPAECTFNVDTKLESTVDCDIEDGGDDKTSIEVWYVEGHETVTLTTKGETTIYIDSMNDKHKGFMMNVVDQECFIGDGIGMMICRRFR